MKYAVLCGSDRGNTKLLADTVAAALPQADTVLCTSYADTPQADCYFVGFWTNQGTADEASAAFLDSLQNKSVFLFGSAGFGGSAEYFEQVLTAVRTHVAESNRIIGTFMCQGKMPMQVRERYVKMQESGVDNPNLPMLIENFDRALSHPDADDLTALRAKVQAAVKP